MEELFGYLTAVLDRYETIRWFSRVAQGENQRSERERIVAETLRLDLVQKLVDALDEFWSAVEGRIGEWRHGGPACLLPLDRQNDFALLVEPCVYADQYGDENDDETHFARRLVQAMSSFGFEIEDDDRLPSALIEACQAILVDLDSPVTAEDLQEAMALDVETWTVGASLARRARRNR